MRSLGLTTIGRLQDVSTELLASAFPTGSAALKELAFGGSDDAVRAGHAAPKSIGHEVTFASDISDSELLQATLLDLADRATGDLRRKGYACRTLALKLRDEHFHTFGGQRTLPDATGSTKVIYQTALALLGDLHPSGCRLRLLGLTLSGLTTDARQLELDDSWREVACDEAVDRVRAKYGAGALRRAGAHLAPYGRGPSFRRLRARTRRRDLAAAVAGVLAMERVSLARAMRWKRRSLYHRLSRRGELVRVRTIERKGRHYRLTLEDGRSFLVDGDHVLYAAPKEEQLPLC